MRRLLWALMAVVLAGGAVVVWRASQPERAIDRVAWPEVRPEIVHELVLQAPSEAEVRLVRGKEGWQVTIEGRTTPANGEAVDALLQALASMRVVRVVAHTRKHDASFGLDAHQATRVALFDAGRRKIAGFLIGRQASTDRMSTYLRLQGDAKVVAVDRALVWLVRRPAQDWRAPAKTTKEQASSKGD